MEYANLHIHEFRCGEIADACWPDWGFKERDMKHSTVTTDPVSLA